MEYEPCIANSTDSLTQSQFGPFVTARIISAHPVNRKINKTIGNANGQLQQ